MSQGRGAGYEGCDVSEMILSSLSQCDVWTMARKAKDCCMTVSRGKELQAHEEASARALW